MITYPWLSILFSFSAYVLLASPPITISISSGLLFDNTKALSLPDWEPEYSFIRGVKEMLVY